MEELKKDYTILSGRNLGKSKVSLEYLEKVLDAYPQVDNEPKRILIVGLGSQPSLSKHMHLILEAAAMRRVEIVFQSLARPTLGSLGSFEPITPNLNYHKVLSFKSTEPINYELSRLRPIETINYPQFEKIKHNPIVGKSSKKGKSNSYPKYHK